MRTRFAVRPLALVVVALLLVAAGAAARVSPLRRGLARSFWWDSADSTSRRVLHQAIDIDAMHDWKTDAAAKWKHDLHIDEEDRGNDLLRVDGLIRHLAAPHAEPANPTSWGYKADINADNLKTGANLVVIPPDDIPHPPTDHPDCFEATLSVMVETNWLGNDQITSYVLDADGRHRKQGSQHFRGGVSGVDQVPPAGSVAHGCLQMLLDAATGEASLEVSIHGIAQAHLVGASLRLGIPGAVGPTIVDLGPVAQWDDLVDGIGLSVDPVVIPAQYVPDVLAGNTYLQVDTTTWPAGEVRGQVVATIESFPPVDFTLVRGTRMTGGALELQAGDDQYLVAVPQAAGPALAVTIDFGMVIPTNDPRFLELLVQSGITGDARDVVEQIRLFDFQSGRFVILARDAARRDDAVHSVRLPALHAPGRFIDDATGRVLARVSWNRRPSSSLTPWLVRVDQVRCEVTQ